MRFHDVPIHDTELVLVLLSTGNLLIERSPNFRPLIDYKAGGVDGIFLDDRFMLKGPGDKTFQNYEYGCAMPYKNMPVLKEWLVQQQLVLN